MTFSSRVKDEVSRLETSRTENIAKLNEYNLRLDTILDIL